MIGIEKSYTRREDDEVEGDTVSDDFPFAEDALLHHDYCSIFMR